MQVKNMLKQTWFLIKPYFFYSEEKWKAILLFSLILALNLSTVYISVLFNEWNRNFYTALQEVNGNEFWHQLGIFSILAFIHILVAVYTNYITNIFKLNWRRWLNHYILNKWLGNKAYYYIQLKNLTDNPDQRIAEDIDSFVDRILSLVVGLISTVVSLASFSVILWNISGTLTLDLWYFGTIHIVGYMFYVAIVYAVLGTIFVHLVGKKLAQIRFDLQKVEANYRYNLVRLRENTESIAFYNNEPFEISILKNIFVTVYSMNLSLIKKVKQLGWFTNFYNQISIIVPFVIASPRFFAKEIPLGVLTQTASAFGHVQQSLSFIVETYSGLATLVAVTRRLTEFMQSIENNEYIEIKNINLINGNYIQLTNLTVKTPDDRTLIDNFNYKFETGNSYLIQGKSGLGKSTLLKSIAGMWPFISGTIAMPHRNIYFIPQRPYLPSGTILDVFNYKNNNLDVTLVNNILDKLNLSKLKESINVSKNWSQELSLGEQQRLAFAAAILNKPDILILDEASSAIDSDVEKIIYDEIKNWCSLLISVGHDKQLENYHNNIIQL